MKKSDFKPLDGTAFEVFDSFVKNCSTGSCERSWANLQLYSNTYRWQWALLEDRLWIGSFEAAYLYYPLGDACPPELLLKNLTDFRNICNDSVTCGDIPFEYAEVFPDAGKFFALDDDPGDYDYIYDLAHLHSFSGAKLRKRHNQLRQFERNYEGRFDVKKISGDDLAEVCALAAVLSQAYWSDSTGLEEKLAFDELQNCWDDPALKLAGIALYVDEKLAGFSIYSALNNEIADIHFEKASREYIGCAAKVTAALVDRLLAENYRFMNREQDLNEDGLRQAKRALDPAMYWKRLNIELV